SASTPSIAIDPLRTAEVCAYSATAIFSRTTSVFERGAGFLHAGFVTSWTTVSPDGLGLSRPRASVTAQRHDDTDRTSRLRQMVRARAARRVAADRGAARRAAAERAVV